MIYVFIKKKHKFIYFAIYLKKNYRERVYSKLHYKEPTCVVYFLRVFSGHFTFILVGTWSFLFLQN